MAGLEITLIVTLLLIQTSVLCLPTQISNYDGNDNLGLSTENIRLKRFFSPARSFANPKHAASYFSEIPSSGEFDSSYDVNDNNEKRNEIGSVGLGFHRMGRSADVGMGFHRLGRSSVGLGFHRMGRSQLPLRISRQLQVAPETPNKFIPFDNSYISWQNSLRENSNKRSATLSNVRL